MLDDHRHVKNQNIENVKKLSHFFNDLHSKLDSLEDDESGKFPLG